MKKSFFMILLILLLITLIAVYTVYQYRSSEMEKQKANFEYGSYYNKTILGTELISIINKSIDNNQKNEIEKDSNNYYIDNGENSIKIYIEFIYKNETKTLQMEDIEKGGTEAFIKTYSTANFKCTKVEYHQKTNKVKSLTFIEKTEEK